MLSMCCMCCWSAVMLHFWPSASSYRVALQAAALLPTYLWLCCIDTQGCNASDLPCIRTHFGCCCTRAVHLQIPSP